MGGHELTPEVVTIDTGALIDQDGDVVRQMALVNSTLALANAALREYGVELIPALCLEDTREIPPCTE